MSAPDIVGILLAAGKGTRFGSDKLLHPLADGTPMAVLAARSLRLACPRCITVLRPAQQALGELLRAEGLTVHFSAEADKGMGHSLAAAVRASHDAAGWIVALADMPLVRARTIAAVVDALHTGASLAAPYYRAHRGHPVGFAGTWLETLCRLRGDQGARHLLAEHAGALVRLPCDDPGILADIDTPAALAGLCREAVCEP